MANTRSPSSAVRMTSTSSAAIRPLTRRTRPCSAERRSIRHVIGSRHSSSSGFTGKRDANSKPLKRRVNQSSAPPTNLGDPVNVVNLEEVGGPSAELELRLVDPQRLDAMVEGGGWNPEPCSSPSWPGNTPPALGEHRLDDLPFTPCL